MSADIIVLIFVILVDIGLVIELLYFILKRNASNKLIAAAFENDEEAFEKAASSLSTKTLSAFDKQLIRFNVAEIRRDFPKMEVLIREFEGMDLKDPQKKKIYPKIFYYCIDRNKKEEAKRYYEKLSQFSVYNNKKDIEMMYDAYLRRGHQYLDDAVRSLKSVSKQDLPTREKLIAKMYENKGVNAEAKKYYRLAEKHETELRTEKRTSEGKR